MDIDYSQIKHIITALGGGINGKKNEYDEIIIKGYTKNNKESANMIMNGKAIQEVKDRIIEWNLFKQINPEITTSADPDVQKNLVKIANSILSLDAYIDDSCLLYKTFKSIFELPIRDLVKFYSKSMALSESIHVILKRLFFTWKDFNEYLLMVLIDEYNKFSGSTMFATSDNNNWDKIFTNKDVGNSSSKIMLLLSPPKKSEFIDSRILILENTTLDKDFNKNITLLSSKLRQYEYLGFCPKEPIKRILHLLEFPTEILIPLINKLDKTKLLGINFNKIYTDILSLINQINKFSESELFISDTIKNNIKKKIKEIPSNKPLNVIECNKLLIKYIDIYIDIDKILLPSLKENELKNIKIAKKISKIIELIENMIQTI